MNKFYSMLLLALILSANLLISKEKQKEPQTQATQIPAVNYLMDNSNLGKNFWVSFPQNEVSTSNLKEVGLEIVCCPVRNTSITLSVPEIGVIKTKAAEAFKSVSFSTNQGDFGWTMQNTDGELVTTKGINLSASEPFCVYVVNVKENSADGYMAVPVCQWDNEYYHCAYYDYYEASGGFGAEPGARGAGFIVVASENSTNVTFTIGGVGKGYAKTTGGHTIGDSWSVALNAGQTYMVRGDGKSKGVFDITGTKIKSNKPVGVISFHMRTMVPSICPDDRDHMNEMMPPVSTLSNNYVTVQLDRKQSSNKTGKGDLFRVVSVQDNTSISCDYFDLNSGKQIGSQGIPLSKAGTFSDVYPILDINDKNTKNSVYGSSHWQSDKPFLLVQNAFSNQWDGDSRWSPLSMVIPPIDQYSQNAVFCVPTQTDYNTNTLTLFAVGDPIDPDQKLLKSVAFDGNEVYKTDTKILANRITGTNIYWTRISLTTGAHFITSKTFISGYITLLSSSNAAGYPMNYNFNKLTYNDYNAPKITKTVNCGNFVCEASEPSSESGISKILLLDYKSSNYTLTIENEANFKPELKSIKQKFDLNPIDASKPALAYFSVMDRAGNITTDSVSYEPASILFDKQSADFGSPRVGTNSSVNMTMKNMNTDTINITKAYIKGTMFTLSNITAPLKLAPNQEVTFSMTYTPNRQSVDKSDFDTLFVESTCISYKFTLTGKAVIPVIQSQDWDFGGILQGTKKCMEEMNTEGYRIDNKGSDKLTIIDIQGIAPPFFLQKPTVPALPFTIDPGGSVYLKSLCFLPSDTLPHSQTITILSDAYEGDSIATIKGKGTAKEEPPKSVNEPNSLFNYLKILPNPVTENTVTLSYGLKTDISVTAELYDEQGKLVKILFSEYKLNGENIFNFSVGNLSAGVYNIKLKAGSCIFSEKFIIAR